MATTSVAMAPISRAMIMNGNHYDPDQQELDEAQLTAYALGQLGEEERAAVEAKLARSEKARRLVEETTALAGHVYQANRQSPPPSPELREAVENHFHQWEDSQMNTTRDPSPATKPARSWRIWSLVALAACLLIAAIPFYFAGVAGLREAAREVAMAPETEQSSAAREHHEAARAGPSKGDADPAAPPRSYDSLLDNLVHTEAPTPGRYPLEAESSRRLEESEASRYEVIAPTGEPQPISPTPGGKPTGTVLTVSGKPVDIRNGTINGNGLQAVPAAQPSLFPTDGQESDFSPAQPERRWRDSAEAYHDLAPGTEQYDVIVENRFVEAVAEAAKSTFSIDVDTASYANVRRFLTSGQWPPPHAVRIEEMVNYFKYDYPLPQGEVPFSVNMEMAQCPWNGSHRLLRIGLKGQEIDPGERGPGNLVFLLDVSGSMRDPNKLPLVKQAMTMLVDQLGEDDRVAIVTYASGTEVRLRSTLGSDHETILAAIDALSAGGSTHGSAGIQLAYEQAVEHFVDGGTNRVILCTDGDLNVGITDDDALVQLIQEKAKSGVFLTVLGFGTGNLKDSKMEKLADKGNGTYAYIDTLREADKVLVEQMSGSLVTIAKDVKIQLEFNPAEVHSYRLVGYENRVLANQDFHDDQKDAGEIGAGHTVTALYEIVPAGGEPAAGGAVGGLKYQRATERTLSEAANSGEMLTLYLRYKEPDGEKSKLLEFVAQDTDKRFGEASADFRFATAVASFGMVLRGSQYIGDTTLSAVEEFAAGAVGEDPGGYRAEFVELVRRARQLRPQ